MQHLHKKIGILAGGGAFPKILAHRLREQNRDFFIIGFENFVALDWLEEFPHKIVRLADVGEILRSLRQQNCQELVLIGPVKRPSWRDIRPDLDGMRVLSKLGKAIFSGDNGLLGSVISFLEEEGFDIRGAHEFLPFKSHSSGVLGTIKLDQRALEDISHGKKLLESISSFDVGQACVVQEGLVLAIEAIEGTDKMLERCVSVKQDGLGGILIKMPKKNQDLRVDMPTIGPLTFDNAYKASLRGIAFLARETLLIEEALCIEKANHYGMFLYGFEREDLL